MSRIDSLKGKYSLIHHNNYIVAFGKNVIVFNVAGAVLFERRDLKNILKVGFVSDSELLVAAGKNYVLISLTNGCDIGVFELPSRTYSFPRFVISKTSKIAYDLIAKNDIRYIVRFDLDNMSVETKSLDKIHGAISDMAFDSNDTLCMLITVYENLSGEDISSNGVLYEFFYPYYGGNVNTYWKAKWNLPFPQSSASFFNGTDMVLTNDLVILDLKTQNKIPLLKSQNQAKSYRNPLTYQIDENGKYVILIYEGKNVILDIEHKRIAEEVTTKDYLYGCIVNGQYWRMTDAGLEKIPLKRTDDGSST